MRTTNIFSTSYPPNDHSPNSIFQFCILFFEVFKFLWVFGAAWGEACGKGMQKNCRVQDRTERALPPQTSTAAERAATSVRPEGPSEESCRNKCRRKERMLRAKRASSPERRGEPATAASSEQRSSTEQGFEHLISIFVLKQKRSLGAIKPGHSQKACHSESSTMAEVCVRQYKQLCFNRSFDRSGCTLLRG